MCKLNLSLIFVLAALVMAGGVTADAPDRSNTFATADATAVMSKPINPSDVGSAQVWTRIAPADMHLKTIPINGWTIFSLQVDNHDAPLNAYIYDKDWNVLAEFDSTGCGAFLQVDAQVVTVIIHNTSMEQPNTYLLHVFD